MCVCISARANSKNITFLHSLLSVLQLSSLLLVGNRCKFVLNVFVSMQYEETGDLFRFFSVYCDLRSVDFTDFE